LIRDEDAMKENPKNGAPGKRRSTWKLFAVVSAILAIVQACLTIEGMGIEGFVLWVLILFIGYWVLFTFLAWLLQKLRERR
jgi:hypothetical protein